MNLCLCLFYPCSCDAGDTPKVFQENGPGLRKASLRVVPKVSHDGGGAAGAERRRGVRVLSPGGRR